MHVLPIPAAPARPLREWQGAAVPKALDAVERKASGIVVAVTGSGKSVALAEVIAQLLRAHPTALVVVTTSSRRLVEQLTETIGARIGRARVGRYYTNAKEADRPVVVACNNSAPALAAVLKGRGRSVDLWIADEAHKTESEGLIVSAAALAAPARLGFTATPFRSDDAETLQLFEELIYRYGFAEALRDRVIVPWRVLPWTGEETTVDDAVLQMVLRHAVGPGVVNASSIRDAEDYAKLLTERGVPAQAVHSQLVQAEQDARLRALEQGGIRCVVYPSLLSEGADFPFLRWIALRRDVQARVRFIQEVGRVLRTHPGKAEALVLDPLGLFGRFSLSYEEELGAPAPSDPPNELGERSSSGPGLPAGPVMVRAAEVLGAWARQLFLAAELDGLLTPRAAPTFDRAGPASPAQVAAVRKLSFAGRWLPAEHTAACRRIGESGDLPNRGCASDLLDVLGTLARRRAPWVPSLPVLAPTEEQLASVRADMDAGGWYAAGACRGGVRALAVVRGARVIATQRKDDPEANTVPTAVHVAAARLAARHAGEGATVHVSDPWAYKVLTGQARPSHPSVQAALDSRAPRATFALVEPKANPAAGLAWGQIWRKRPPQAAP